MRGRPFSFLATLAGLWVTARVAMWLPDYPAERVREVQAAAPTAQPTRTIATFLPPALTGLVPVASTGRVPPIAPLMRRPKSPPLMTDAQILASVGVFYFAEIPAASAFSFAVGRAETIVPLPSLPRGDRATPDGPSRWSLDAWTLARSGSESGALTPQLGGSQAGVRLGYFLDVKRRTAAYVRATSALKQPDVELAAGVQAQPTKAPVAGFVEARRRTSGAVVPVAGVVGGVYRAPIVGTWRLDGYGQAGIVAGKRREGFADAQVRVTRPIGTAGPAAFEAGVGGWGGAQRDAARLDVGPTLGVELPVHSGRMRLMLDWRQRVAGHAAPASGPALTLAAGF